MLRTYLIRSDARAVFSVLSSGATVWTNTKEASPTEMLVPSPTLVFGIKRAGAVAFAGSAAAYMNSASSAPAPGTAASEPEPTAPPEAQKMPDVLAGDVREVADEKEPLSSSEPVTEAPGRASAEEQPLTPDAEAPGTLELAAQTPVWAQAVEQHPADAGAPKIHLSIDSLPRLQLVEAIPVTVTQMGDKLYTATIDAIRLTGTSSTMGEALVTVKEEIESLYGRLTKSMRLDADEEGDLQYLLAHIKSSEPPREHKRGPWRASRLFENAS